MAPPAVSTPPGQGPGCGAAAAARNTVEPDLDGRATTHTRDPGPPPGAAVPPSGAAIVAGGAPPPVSRAVTAASGARGG